MKNKLKKEELEKVRQQQSAINEILAKIGYMESQKHGLLHELAEVNGEVENFKSELESEYGSITVDMETGEYKKIEEEKKELHSV